MKPLETIVPDPDSHYRLVPCKDCGPAAVVAYEKYKHPEGTRWRTVCKGCGATVAPEYPAPRHEVQVLWNRRNKYDFQETAGHPGRDRNRPPV